MNNNVLDIEKANPWLLGIGAAFCLLLFSGVSPGFIFWILILALFPTFVAASKGRNVLNWYLYSILLWIVALIHSFVAQSYPDPNGACLYRFWNYTRYICLGLLVICFFIYNSASTSSDSYEMMRATGGIGAIFSAGIGMTAWTQARK